MIDTYQRSSRFLPGRERQQQSAKNNNGLLAWLEDLVEIRGLTFGARTKFIILALCSIKLHATVLLDDHLAFNYIQIMGSFSQNPREEIISNDRCAPQSMGSNVAMSWKPIWRKYIISLESIFTWSSLDCGPERSSGFNWKSVLLLNSFFQSPLLKIAAHTKLNPTSVSESNYPKCWAIIIILSFPWRKSISYLRKEWFFYRTVLLLQRKE